MAEKKARFSPLHVVYVVPALFALLFAVVILLPFVFALGFIIQAGLQVKAAIVCAILLAMGLDYMVFMRINDSNMSQDRRSTWKKIVLFAPILGSLAFYFAKPDGRHFEVVEGSKG